VIEVEKPALHLRFVLDADALAVRDSLSQVLESPTQFPPVPGIDLLQCGISASSLMPSV